jgi:hypothetical protein
MMARHETVYRRLKQFGILKQIFRHPLEKHPRCNGAVINIVEIMIENNEPLYNVVDINS